MENNTKKRFPGLPVILVIAVIIAANALYSVNPVEFAAVRQFGEIVSVENEPGLHVHVPFIQSVQKISAATILYDVPASDVITKDKKTMISNNYILWRVVDAKKYVQTLGAARARAEERIEATVYNATKNVISSMTQDEIVASRGEVLTRKITEEANSDIGEYGIEIIKSEIKALDLPDDNKEAVYERMISERQNIAASYTAEGASEAQMIRNETDKSVSIMASTARKDAEVLIAEGEAEFMRVLQEAYNTKDKAEFYNYLRSLDALQASLKGGQKTIILDKDSELASILYSMQGE